MGVIIKLMRQLINNEEGDNFWALWEIDLIAIKAHGNKVLEAWGFLSALIIMALGFCQFFLFSWRFMGDKMEFLNKR